jgi:hypothetical protein
LITIVAIGFIANINEYIGFFAHQGTLNADPVIHGLIQRGGGALLTISRRIMHFQHTDEVILLAQGNDVGHVSRIISRPAVAAA